MKATKELFSDISKHTHNQLTMYRFNIGTLQISDKYREGRITALEYVSELTLYYMNQEKELRKHLVREIDKQMYVHSCLSDSEYKHGLYDGLNDVLDTYREITT